MGGGVNPNDFDFAHSAGSDGGFLESPQEAEIVEHQIAWHRAKQMIAFVKFAKAVDAVIAAIWLELEPILTRWAAELTKIMTEITVKAMPGADDLKAAERARSKADVKAKRREMMKRRGRK
jgi:hypothetical protein